MKWTRNIGYQGHGLNAAGAIVVVAAEWMTARRERKQIEEFRDSWLVVRKGFNDAAHALEGNTHVYNLCDGPNLRGVDDLLEELAQMQAADSEFVATLYELLKEA